MPEKQFEYTVGSEDDQETSCTPRIFVGVKMVEAWPEKKDGKPGYAVKYEDGYTSWSPKDVFERFYYPLEDGDQNMITQADVDGFIREVTADQLDEKTTLVRAETLTGFRHYEVSSCVDPKNYDQEVGEAICVDRIKNRIWPMLGFVLQWASKGLK